MTSSDYDIAAEYAGKADHYARHWAPVLVALTPPLLAVLPLAGARRILDVGTGSGGHLPVLRRAAPEATLVGVDLSLGMLRQVRSGSGARLAAMAIDRLGFRAAAFDLVLSTFVLQHVADPAGAFREIGRALKPGGWIGLATWGPDHTMPGADLWVEELDRHGAGPDPRPDENFRELVDAPQKLEALLGATGFQVERTWREHGTQPWSRDQLMAVQSTVCSPSRRLKTLPDDRRHACEASARRRIDALSDAELIYRPEVVFAVARRAA